MRTLRKLQLNLISFPIGAMLACSPAFGQKDASLPTSSSKELHGVLILARDAIIELTNRDEGTSDEPDSNEKKIRTLYEYLLLTDDREDVAYLRDHLPKKYAVDLEAAASIPSDRNSFSVLVKDIEAEEGSSQHDIDLASVVSQEIQRGFLEDALAHSALLNGSMVRYQTQGHIAVAAHEAGKADLALAAVNAAIHSALDERSTGNPILEVPSRSLDRLAGSFLENNFREAARKTILRNKQLLSASPSSNGFD